MDIILIAGLWLDARSWDAAATRLAEAGHRPHPVEVSAAPTLDAALESVLDALEDCDAPALVVGHSAAATLAWLAADRRPDRVARVALVGGMPSSDGEPYFDGLAPVDGELAFPGWEPFEGPDAADLTPELRAEAERHMRPVAEGFVTAAVRYLDEKRHGIPVAMLCPEYSPDDARQWLAAGHIPELEKVEGLTYVDLDSGHWPQFSAPDALAAALAELAAPRP